MTYQPDWISSGPPTPPRRPRTGRRLAVAGGVAAVLAAGGVAVAQASASSAPASPSPSASPSASGSTAPEKREQTPHLAGTVVSASGGTITITDREGFQRTIHTTSATTYEDGLTATPAAGTEIVAEGTVDTDKTSLEATKIAKRPARPEGGFGRGGRGHHGPGDRDGDGPGAAGTPSPSTPSPAPTS